ncbi:MULTISPECIES: hypothetical protein [Streptomyces]|uniref:hypothetical protein n=1 Tax=Streptomyces TaxID=1883 RepID=UPI00131CF6EF
MSSALVLALAPGAEALVWTSSINDGSPGFESRRWSDQSYSQIQFYDCSNRSTTGTPDSVDVQIWRDISLQPDDAYDNKTFTACYGAGASNGEWTDLPATTVTVYFQLMKVGSTTSPGFATVDVGYLSVDTTKAD